MAGRSIVSETDCLNICVKGCEVNVGPIVQLSRQEEHTMDRYVCTVCGYVYDPAEGDPDSGVKPGTAFEDLPDDWTCPICGATKDQFEKEE